MTPGEYNSCVDKHADGIYRFVLKNIRDKDTSMDIVQDTFEKLWNHISNVSINKGKSYLFTTAYHTMIDYIRKDKHNFRYDLARQSALISENGYSDLKEILDAALKMLPEVQRAVILLRDYEGYSYKEIGDITGLNESQVKVYIYRGRIALKNYIVSLDKVL
ncbi:MAG: RNA polymerase sigma factor [Bacteroidetes bacterium]|nr:RNA polymerase sigma factor [Bacteroidota bacterium]